MHTFRRGELDVLISTTVIEVGVDVPNATVMVILDADRFGIAQLHQLRGRVGRGADASVCWLVASPTTPKGRPASMRSSIPTTGLLWQRSTSNFAERGPSSARGRRVETI